MLKVAAHEDQTPGAELAFSGGDAGTDTALRSFEFGFLFRQFFPEDQVPGVHIGPHNVARAERGVVLERTATAQAVEDGNQELKSDREEVEKMEGMLWRARAMVVQVAKQLAVKVRERFERSRGRDGPDHGWSR